LLCGKPFNVLRIFFEELLLGSLPRSRELIDIKAFPLQQEAMLDEAEDGVEPLHPVDDLKKRLLARCASSIREQEQWKGIIFEDAVNKLLFLSDGPDKFPLVLPIHN